MARVEMTLDAKETFESLPVVIRSRIQGIMQRLKAWPAVSGAKPLRGKLAGSYRIRTGDYRLVFNITNDKDEDGHRIEIVLIWKIGNRKDVYLD